MSLLPCSLDEVEHRQLGLENEHRLGKLSRVLLVSAEPTLPRRPGRCFRAVERDVVLSKKCWCIKWCEGPSVEISRMCILKRCTSLLNIPMFASVPRKPVLCPVRYWLEADLCPLQTLSPQKGPPAKVKSHRGKRRRRGRRKSTKSGLAQGHAPPSTTRPPNPGPGPTRRQSTVSPVPIARRDVPGGCAGRPWRGAAGDAGSTFLGVAGPTGASADLLTAHAQVPLANPSDDFAGCLGVGFLKLVSYSQAF